MSNHADNLRNGGSFHDYCEAADYIDSLEREIRYLRHYGNKDCTHMADKAMERGDLDEVATDGLHIRIISV